MDYQLAHNKVLTLAELEALASLGASWLLTLNDTRVASKEAFCTQSRLVFFVDLDKSTSDSEASGFALTLESSTLEVDLDVILFYSVERRERLANDIL